MFAAAFLFATYTTFGPIAQTEDFLFTATADEHSIQRIAKDDPAAPHLTLAESTHRIAAMDHDGGDVIYGTALTQTVTMEPIGRAPSAYHRGVVRLSDTEPHHAIWRVRDVGGVPREVVTDLPGVIQLAHDDSWIYWMEPSTEADERVAADASLRRVDKSGLIVETIAGGLTVSYTNQHPFVLVNDDVYFVSGDRLLRVAKSGGAAIDIAKVVANAPIAANGDTIYFSAPHLFVMKAGAVLGSLPNGRGVTKKVLGAGPGFAVVEAIDYTPSAAAWIDWVLAGACPPAAQIGRERIATGSPNDGYYIPPLAAPPIAIDDRGIWLRDRLVPFAAPPQPCVRERATHR